jgi:hypothetical protein
MEKFIEGMKRSSGGKMRFANSPSAARYNF